jgi:hypothetical protein
MPSINLHIIISEVNLNQNYTKVHNKSTVKFRLSANLHFGMQFEEQNEKNSFFK